MIIMKRMSIPLGIFVVVLGGLLSTGCRSSLKVPFVDLSLGTPGHSHSHDSKTHKLEHQVEELEDQNRELRERVEELEQSSR